MTQLPSVPSNWAPYFEDKIDYRKYIVAVANRWKLIVGLAIVAAVAAFLTGSLAPRQYTAEAAISFLNVRSEVVFDEQFKTVPDEEATANRSSNRRDALRALAENTSLLAEVFAELSPQLEPDGRSFTAFRDAVQSQVAGDLLRLQVTWDDPEIAATIANEWARRYVAVANQSYLSTSSETPEAARAVADDAFKKYQTAQEQLEAFIAENDLDQLGREIAELDALIEELQAQKTNALGLANSTPILSANRLANTTRDVLLDQMDLSVQSQADDRAHELNDWYERKTGLEQLQKRLEDLKGQIEAGNTSAAAAGGDALALMFTRAGLLGQDSSPGLLLQIDLNQLGETGRDLTPSDVEGLLRIVADGLGEADREIERLTGELFRGTGLEIPTSIPSDHELFQVVNSQVEAILNADVVLETESAELEAKPLSRTLARLSDRRQVLQSQTEKLEAKQRELTRDRDTAWDLYTTLDNKAREVEAQFATGAPQVRLALQALPPADPNPRGRLRLLLIAAMLGGIVGVVYAFVREYWQSSAPEAPPSAPEQPLHLAADKQ